ncbi:MAG: hypothetical protein RJB60_1207, partial [Pseudomonadota bacterium]
MPSSAFAYARSASLTVLAAAALTLPLGAQATTFTSTFYGSGSVFDKGQDTFNTIINGVGLT